MYRTHEEINYAATQRVYGAVDVLLDHLFEEYEVLVERLDVDQQDDRLLELSQAQELAGRVLQQLRGDLNHFEAAVEVAAVEQARLEAAARGGVG